MSKKEFLFSAQALRAAIFLKILFLFVITAPPSPMAPKFLVG